MNGVPTTIECHDRIMGILSGIGDFSSRKMMGEYCIYYKGKMVAELCDDRFLLKPTESVRGMMPDAPMEYPYEGSKTLMAVVDDIGDLESFKELVKTMYSELPEPKKRARK